MSSAVVRLRMRKPSNGCYGAIALAVPRVTGVISGLEETRGGQELPPGPPGAPHRVVRRTHRRCADQSRRPRGGARASGAFCRIHGSRDPPPCCISTSTVHRTSGSYHPYCTSAITAASDAALVRLSVELEA